METPSCCTLSLQVGSVGACGVSAWSSRRTSGDAGCTTAPSSAAGSAGGPAATTTRCSTRRGFRRNGSGKAHRSSLGVAPLHHFHLFCFSDLLCFPTLLSLAHACACVWTVRRLPRDHAVLSIQDVCGAHSWKPPHTHHHAALSQSLPSKLPSDNKDELPLRHTLPTTEPRLTHACVHKDYACATMNK